MLLCLRTQPYRQGHLGWADWAGARQQNCKGMVPSFLQPRELFQLTLPYSRAHPLNLLHRLYNRASSSKRREMPQSHATRSTNSYHTCITVSVGSTPNSANFYVANNHGCAGRKAEILRWLSSLGSRTRHNWIRARRVEHVGAWLLRTEEYQNWSDVRSGEPSGSVLFCYGDPGAGKTYIRQETISSNMMKVSKRL